jgi:hypothetical protein
MYLIRSILEDYEFIMVDIVNFECYPILKSLHVLSDDFNLRHGLIHLSTKFIIFADLLLTCIIFRHLLHTFICQVWDQMQLGVVMGWIL